MPSIPRLVVRDDSGANGLTPTMVTLIVVLLCLTVAGLFALIALFVLRNVRARRNRQEFQEIPSSNHSLAIGRKHGHRRTLTITTVSPYSAFSAASSQSGGGLASEKAAFLSSPTASSSPPGSAGVPEIHITFPEDDSDVRRASSKRNSGHVVVVRISDNGGVGLAPCTEEGSSADEKRDGEWLPPYQAGQGQEWRSLDLESMGGLKEKGSGEKQWA